MINEMLWIGLLLICLMLVILAYSAFGKTGLYVWVAAAIVIANIQVMKTIEFFGLVTSLGNVVYASIFLVTDILNEMYGSRSARKAIWIGFFVLISTTIVMQLTLQFIPHSSDFINPHITAIFSFLPRIAFASLIAYFISQMHDIWFFAKLKKKTEGKYLWLRNNVSTMTSQFIDTVIFTFIAFVGVFSWDIVISIFFTTLLMKIIIAAADTPFIYWAKRIGRR